MDNLWRMVAVKWLNSMVYGRYNELVNGDYNGLQTGWWFQPTPLKNDGVKVSWDDDIPN